MRAAGRLDADFGLAERADLRRGRFGLLFSGLLLGQLMQTVETAHDQEQDESDDEEIDDRGQERTVADRNLADTKRELGQVDVDNQSDQRRNDVIRQRIDNRLECRTDDDANRHVNDVAAA